MNKVVMIQGIDDGFLGVTGWRGQSPDKEIEPFYGFVDGDHNKTLIIDASGIAYYEYNQLSKVTDSWAISTELTYEAASEMASKITMYPDIEPFLYMIHKLGVYSFG